MQEAIKHIGQSKPSFLTTLYYKMRTSSYSDKTITAYLNWIKEYILFNDKNHLAEFSKENIGSFLT